MLNSTVEAVTNRIITRSQPSRSAYLSCIHRASDDGPNRRALSCSNLAHGMAACAISDKSLLAKTTAPNIAIVSAYNDMLSAHQPFKDYPEQIKRTAASQGAVAQFAGGVPAMCDGITQGQDGMELSLFSRDVIALSTAVALSHNMFDGALSLGVCDKIVPGLLIGALSFGHLPVVFVPAGPMVSGLSNKEKASMREEYAAGRISRAALLDAEAAAYHSPGTCTFYGTANSNQMLMEFMGLQLPGGSLVNPGGRLRELLTREAVLTVLKMVADASNYTPLGEIVSERAIVNAMVGLLATGGSTNHTIHLVAIARAAGILIDWQDFSDLSDVTPLLARVYPNGTADVNHFHAAGGLGYCIAQLLDAGLLHDNVKTICGPGLRRFCVEPFLDDNTLVWRSASNKSLDRSILRSTDDPFDSVGGLRVVSGNIGRAIVKISALPSDRRAIHARARVFQSQAAFKQAFDADQLHGDMVVVIQYQGPRANGMPELHKLTPYLGVLQAKGQQVALLTDGRLSGASGAVLATIQVTPEALDGGLIARIRDGDWITIDAEAGALNIENSHDVMNRSQTNVNFSSSQTGMGRELFTAFRHHVTSADQGASILFGN